MVGLIHVSSPWVVPVSGFTAEAVTFDGINDHLIRGADLTGNANSVNGLTSFWIRFNSLGAQVFVSAFDGISELGFFIAWNTSDSKFRIRGQDGGNVHFEMKSATAYTTGEWYNVLASWNGTTMHMYVNGVEDVQTEQAPDGSATDYTIPDWGVGGHVNGTQLVDGDFSEFYWTNEYLDLSVAANRDKFYNSTTDTPVDLGSDGSTPTGTAPLIYFTGVASIWNAGTNSGSGGNFTMTGAVTDSSNEPVDAT